MNPSAPKNEDELQQLVHTLLTMEASTTKWLEQLAGKKLQVSTEFQKAIYEDQKLEIIRLVKLHFGDPAQPIMLAITSLPKANLEEEEMRQLKAGNIPLGKVFGITESAGFRKTNIIAVTHSDDRLARKLNVTDTGDENACFKKEYTLVVQDRVVGTVKEVFTKESFKRIWM